MKQVAWCYLEIRDYLKEGFMNSEGSDEVFIVFYVV